MDTYRNTTWFPTLDEFAVIYKIWVAENLAPIWFPSVAHATAVLLFVAKLVQDKPCILLDLFPLLFNCAPDVLEIGRVSGLDNYAGSLMLARTSMLPWSIPVM